MPTFTIDEQRIEAQPGETILQAARRAGVEIPTLCYLEGFEAGASCMVCAVKNLANGQFIPACGSRVVDGMKVEHATAEVRETRKMALELLFSDHLGDCLSPCQRICPANLGIPAMLKQLRAGEFGLAAASARRDLALAGILCRICHRPCEHGCRRSDEDEAVAIGDLVTHAIETEIAAGPPRPPWSPSPQAAKVAIIGAGFTGLSTAWFLASRGYACVVVDGRETPESAIRAEFPDVPEAVLQAEIGLLERAGAVFRMGVRITGSADLDALLEETGAVVLATGVSGSGMAAALGLNAAGNTIAVDKESMMTSRPGVFAGGRLLRPKAQPVGRVADGKALAHCVDQYLTGDRVRRPHKPFSVFMGRLVDGEMTDFMQQVSRAPRSEAGDMAVDLERAIEESHRCVHCNCAKADVCKLRQLAVDHGVDMHRFSSGERLRFKRDIGHPLVCFEPGKCIRCGNCIKVAGDHSEALGLTFIGRGFDVHLGVPFSDTLADGLLEAARAAVDACPTGALTLREPKPAGGCGCGGAGGCGG
ncbi:MAG: (2Fe-2S)-binding protein [Verrucomicrobia bacterium]|nr:(2Fe-2S)-binding protein [Verrucomicrobiota bacterium]